MIPRLSEKPAVAEGQAPGVSPVADPIIRRLAILMDSALRVGPFSVGLDGILGLIPGIGDALGGLISAYIIWRAAQAGVPRATQARMMANVAIDTLLGSVPIVGDIFDFAWKSNMKNLRLYEEWLGGRRKEGRDLFFTIAVVAGIILILLIPIAVLVLVLRALLVR